MKKVILALFTLIFCLTTQVANACQGTIYVCYRDGMQAFHEAIKNCDDHSDYTLYFIQCDPEEEVAP